MTNQWKAVHSNSIASTWMFQWIHNKTFFLKEIYINMYWQSLTQVPVNIFQWLWTGIFCFHLQVRFFNITFLNCRKFSLHRINTFSDKTPLYFLRLVQDSGWTKPFHLSHGIFPAFKASLWKKSIFWQNLACGLSRQQWKVSPQWGTTGSRLLTAQGSVWHRPCQQAYSSFLLGTLLKHLGFNST